jgi:hypothetical protein
MSALDLQQILVDEFKTLFDGQVFQKPKKNVNDNDELVPLNIYSQALPFNGGTVFNDFAPFLYTQITDGGQTDEDEPEDVKVMFYIGIYDDDKANQGHVTVSNIIETIRQRLFLKRTFGGKYYIKLPFKWTLNDDDMYPKFAGAIETHWSLPLIVPEDPNL